MHFLIISFKGKTTIGTNFDGISDDFKRLHGIIFIVVLFLQLVLQIVNCWLRRYTSNLTQTIGLLYHLRLHLYSQHLREHMSIIKAGRLRTFLMMNVISVNRKVTRSDNILYCWIKLQSSNPNNDNNNSDPKSNNNNYKCFQHGSLETNYLNLIQ